MIGLGGLMMLIAIFFGYLAWTNRPLACPCLLKILPWLMPIPYIANSFGWYVAEGGRQPWLVVGLQRTAEGISPNLTGAEVWFTMIGFTVTYLLLAIAALWIVFRFVRKTQVISEGRDA